MSQNNYLQSDLSMNSIEASLLYRRMSRRARWRTRWSRLHGRFHQLPCLGTIRTTSERSRRHGGTRSVPLDQIRGSENRCGDFDTEFAPLQDHTRDRWIRVAAARLRGTPLPPVELIQVGEDYFVRDGHHRISVNRALGGSYIDAIVTVWE